MLNRLKSHESGEGEIEPRSKEGVSQKSEVSVFADLLPALKNLDQLLAGAIEMARTAYGPAAGVDPYRGLHIGDEEVKQLLDRQPGSPLLWTGSPDRLSTASTDTSRSGFAFLQETFALSPFDLDVIVIALAPEFDLRYERLYAYLQDNVSLRKPSIDLILNLLCATAEEKCARRRHFSSEAPLVKRAIVRLAADPNNPQPTLLSKYVKLNGQISRMLLGQEGLEAPLIDFCKLSEPSVDFEGLPLNSETGAMLRLLAQKSSTTHEPLRMYFHGPVGICKRSAAEAFACKIGAPFLVADAARMPQEYAAFSEAVSALFNEVLLRDALLLVENIDALQTDEKASRITRILEELDESDRNVVILAGTKPWSVPIGLSIDVIPIAFSMPGFDQRLTCWKSTLNSRGLSLDAEGLESLSDRFKLTPAQIRGAVATAINTVRCRNATGQFKGDLSISDLFMAARNQAVDSISSLAGKISPKYAWDDIVLPEDTLAQLRELCKRVTGRNRVMNEWGFDAKLSLGKGTNALFAGPSGTGKTMAAEVIAHELGLDLYKIDLSGIVSKYIGETEKNLDRIFSAAESANAILFFDEADALFGKRSEVRDAHDRYANIEISYLLQKMEQYEGITILATNLRHNMDEAFVRRLAFTIHFPFPDEESRKRIWTGIWPAKVPLGAEVDVGFLSGRFKLNGGNIKNAALAAAYLASADGGVVTMPHLLHAVQREFQKMGKTLTEVELFGEMKTASDRGKGS